MAEFAPRALATGIGSLPHPDPYDALRLILSTFPTIPFWPQLSRRDFRENMYAQFSEDLVGVKIDLPHEWMGAVIDDDTLAGVEHFYTRYLENDPRLFAVGRDYAAGLYALHDQRAALRDAKWIKGQVTGPISFGLKVVDQNLRPMLYDDTLRDVLVKHLARKAQWQEEFLADVGAIRESPLRPVRRRGGRQSACPGPPTRARLPCYRAVECAASPGGCHHRSPGDKQVRIQLPTNGPR